MKADGLVSVVIPVYNNELHVGEAIRSVLDQTYRNLEVVAVNDGSADGSLAILKGFGPPVKVLDLPHRATSSARNSGVAAASGDFLAFLDADDLWMEDYLELQMAQFQEDPELEISYVHFESFLSPELDEETKRKRMCPEDPLPGYIPSCTVVRREAFEKVGPYDESLLIGEFMDWCSRSKDIGLKSRLLAPTKVRRRIHATNTGVTLKKNRVEYLKIAKAHLERKRKLKNPQ